MNKWLRIEESEKKSSLMKLIEQLDKKSKVRLENLIEKELIKRKERKKKKKKLLQAIDTVTVAVEWINPISRFTLFLLQFDQEYFTLCLVFHVKSFIKFDNILFGCNTKGEVGH